MANKYNLDTIVSRYIHRPIIKGSKDLPPLYARVINSEDETKSDLEGMKDPKWIDMTSIVYNSPTNVRRLFIGDKKVFIQYYQPIVNKKSTSKDYWTECTIDSSEQLDVIFKQYLNPSLRDGKALQIVKTGLGAVSNNWKMSNIEEIFITPSVLISQDADRILGQPAKGMLSAMMNKSTGAMQETQQPMILFERTNGENIKDIRNRFPRLRTVAFMTNIESAMNLPNARNLREGLPAQSSELALKWIDHMIKNGLGKTSSILRSTITAPIGDFIVRSGTYKFDAEVLDGFAKKYKEKSLEIARENRDKKLNLNKEDADNKNRNTKSEYETYLDSIMETKGEAIVQSALQLTFARSKDEEIRAELKKMSKDGEEKYRKLIGRG